MVFYFQICSLAIYLAICKVFINLYDFFEARKATKAKREGGDDATTVDEERLSDPEDPFIRLLKSNSQDFLEIESFFMDSIVVLIMNLLLSVGTQKIFRYTYETTNSLFEISNFKFLANLIIWILLLWRGTTKEKMYSARVFGAITLYTIVLVIIDVK